MGADDAAHQRSVNGRRSSLATHVADHNPEPRHGIGNEIVKISTDGARRDKFCGYVEVSQPGIGLGQQPTLQLTGQREIAFQTAFLPLNLLVKAGILNRDRDLRRKRGHGALVLISEEAAPGMLEVEYSNYLALVDQWDYQFRAGLGIGLYIAGIFGHIGDQHALFALGCISHQAATHWDLMLELNILVEAQGEAMLQLLA